MKPMQTCRDCFCFSFSHKKTMWSVYVCDTVWKATDISLPSFFSFFNVRFVVPLVVFLSKIETVRYCRPPSHIAPSAMPLDCASYGVTPKQALFARLPPLKAPSFHLSAVSKQKILTYLRISLPSVLSPRFGSMSTKPACEITARMCQTLCLSRFYRFDSC